MQSAEGLVWGKLTYAYTSFVTLIPNIVAGIVMLGLFAIGAIAADRAIRRGFRNRGQADLGHLLGGFARWATLGLGCLVAATIIFPSVKPSDVLGALGFGSVAIGFAFKDILQN